MCSEFDRNIHRLVGYVDLDYANDLDKKDHLQLNVFTVGELL